MTLSLAGRRTLKRTGRVLLAAYVLAISAFLVAPVAAITLGSLTASRYVSFPPEGLSLKWYLAILEETEYLQALGLSLAVAAASATVATALSVPVVLAMHRYPTRLNGLLNAVVLTPVMLPSIFIGLALLIAYSRMGFAGTPFGLFAGHVVMSTPFAVSLIHVGFSTLDPTLERAARGLGAGRWTVLRRITLPLIAWSLAAGWGFAFMMSFGNLEVSLFLSTPTVVTLPVAIYTALEWSPLDPLLTAVASGLVIITLVVLLSLSRAVRIERIMRLSGQ